MIIQAFLLVSKMFLSNVGPLSLISPRRMSTCFILRFTLGSYGPVELHSGSLVARMRTVMVGVVSRSKSPTTVRFPELLSIANKLFSFPSVGIIQRIGINHGVNHRNNLT